MNCSFFQGAGIPPSFLPVTHDSLRLIDQTKTICEQRIYLDEAKELFSLISSKFLLVGAGFLKPAAAASFFKLSRSGRFYLGSD